MGQATVILTNEPTRRQFCAWVMKAPPRTVASLRGVKRSIPQNARLWAMLTDVARQAEWAGKKRTTDDWKDLFSAAVKVAGGLEAVPGLEGGLMILGLRTSQLSVNEMADLQTYIESWGAQHGVVFGDHGSEAPRDGEPANNGSPVAA